MTKNILILIILLFIANTAFATDISNINKSMNMLSNSALNKLENNSNQIPLPEITNKNVQFQSGALQAIKLHDEFIKKNFKLNDNQILSGDTLWVGKTPNDTLRITDTSTIKKTIFVFNDGVLIISKAFLTVLGDLLVWGQTAKVIIEDSYLYFPQEYFYQRTMFAAAHGSIKISNTTLDYSGLSHNLAAMDSASIEMNNVHLIGFTTNGLWGTPTIKIDGTNQAGEYIMTGSAKLDFKNAHTILLWHKLDSASEFNVTFPRGDTVASYILNKNTSGIKGVNFTVNVENSTDVMWALMPDKGSNINITNSTIRAIGLWFTSNDTINVSGLVNNSTYQDFLAPIPDRTLNLKNSKVQTWSLYPMQHSYINLSGCILGEVGAETRSGIFAQSIYVDGTGGYFWASDTSFVVAGFSSFTTSVRTEKTGIMLLGYSAVTNGIASAIGNSVLIVTQSSLPEPPKALEGGVVWFLNIDQPSTAYTEKLVPITGSAWIQKGPQSLLMDFSYYRMYYKKQEDLNWTQIGSYFKNEKHNDTLAFWNTHGLPAGAYQIKLVVTDNSKDSNNAEAMKGVNLLPIMMSVEDNSENNFDFNVFPNPVYATFSLEMCLYDCNIVTVKLHDESGNYVRTLFDGELKSGRSILAFSEDKLSNISSGLYFLQVQSNGKTLTKPVMILK